MGRDETGHGIGDFAVDADDAFSEEAGVDVEGSFAGGAGFEDYGDEVVVDGGGGDGTMAMATFQWN